MIYLPIKGIAGTIELIIELLNYRLLNYRIFHDCTRMFWRSSELKVMHSIVSRPSSFDYLSWCVQASAEKNLGKSFIVHEISLVGELSGLPGEELSGNQIR